MSVEIENHEFKAGLESDICSHVAHGVWECRLPRSHDIHQDTESALRGNNPERGQHSPASLPEDFAFDSRCFYCRSKYCHHYDTHTSSIAEHVGSLPDSESSVTPAKVETDGNYILDCPVRIW